MAQTILLLDYEPRTVVRVTEALTSLGCELVTAKDVDAAVNACAAVEPRAVLITSVLPRLKVEDAITQLRARAGLRHTPFVVLMSGYSGVDRKADAAKLGAQEIVVKPFSNEELLAAVKSLVAKPRGEAVGTDSRADVIDALRRSSGLAREGGTVTSEDLFGDLISEEPEASPAATQRIAIPQPPSPPAPSPIASAAPAPRQDKKQAEAARSVDDVLANTLAELGGAPAKPAKPRETTGSSVDKLLSQTLSGMEVRGAGATPPKPAPREPEIIPAPPPRRKAVEPAPGPLPGGTPFGQYELIEPIATGGMAEVYKARMRGVEGFQKIVAIKRILGHLTDNDEFVTMFIDEAKLAAQLQHSNIIHIYDLGKIERSYYIAMEYIDGKDLRTILRQLEEKNSRLPLGLAVFIASGLAAALDYAHRKRDLQGKAINLVHRDVSPQNVLISYDGDIKLCDFGIAKAASKASHTRAGALKGKLQYMSPEQAWGKDIDSRSDIFSLGLVLYEMLTGRKGFAGDSEMSILEQVRAPKLKPPRDVDPSIPPEVERVTLKALKEDRDERFQSAADFANELGKILQSLRPSPSSTEVGAFVSELFGRERLVAATAAPAARPAAAPAPSEPAPAPPKPRAVSAPAPAEAALVEVSQILPPRRSAPIGLIAGAAVAVIAVVAAILFMVKDHRTPPGPQTAVTPAPETVAMARQVAQQEVDKQAQAMRERLTGEILKPTQADGRAADQAQLPKPAAAPAATQAPQQPAAQAPAAAPTVAQALATAPTAAPVQPTRVVAAPTQAPTQAPKQAATPAPATVQEAAAPVATRPPLALATEEAPVHEGDLVEVGADVVPPLAILSPKPAYPPIALRQGTRVSGIVILEVLVDENGSVQDVHVLRGIKPDLGFDRAAAEAVRQWRFKPATKNGVRVKVKTTQTISFKAISAKP